VANSAFQLAVEKISRPARLCRIGETFSDAPFDCFRARGFPIEAGFYDFLPLTVPVPVRANRALLRDVTTDAPHPAISWADTVDPFFPQKSTDRGTLVSYFYPI
jgi:hypothetical protein